MSLILEALRKSEAERRRGLAPDVAMELPPTTVRRARETPAWAMPAIVLAALALLAAWWWSQRDARTTGAAPPDAGPQAVAPRIAASPQPTVVARSMQPVVAPAAQSPVPEVPHPSPAAAQAAAQPAPSVATPRPAIQPVPPAPASDVADIDATALPPVKLSMHMWDESPAKRFVILDSQRMGEGDRNGELTVIAIERNGVVIERNGQRARVSLP